MKRFFNSLASKKTEGFQLSERFLERYRDQRPAFGYNGLGEIVYRRTYSRRKPNGQSEQWWETVERVVNGTYRMQKRWIDQHQLGWNQAKAQQSAQEMFERIFNMKFLPPGRGLWAMGSALTEEKHLYAALNNCAFVSTVSMKQNPSKPFTFLMDATMLGVGVGFDTRGAGSFVVKGLDYQKKKSVFVIPDSREGWVESVRLMIDACIHGKASIIYDYSLIRPKDSPIKGFGGLASGPEPLRLLLQDIEAILNNEKQRGHPISTTSIVDLMNLIGRCVVSGNVRRAAEIAFGGADDDEYLNLKNYNLNPHRVSYGWTSNNSVFAELGMDYHKICNRIRDNGEPGIAWLDNMRNYARMNGVLDTRDHRAVGGNPCLEQTLESYELCCLVETFPFQHDSIEDFQRTLKFAYLYAKTVTLGQTHWPETNRVMLRNRRIGCSVSGIANFLGKRNLHELRTWLEKGYETIQHYDKIYSDWLAIPKSIKTTSVKPSGTVSLLCGSTPGMHFPESRYYVRRLRLSNTSDLLPALQKAGYHSEPAVDQPDTTVVVEIPIDVGSGVRTIKDVSMWEQLSMAAFFQRYWADNQVSCTVAYDPKIEGPHLEHALNIFQYQLKGISFLPLLDKGAYPQMPYEEITEADYKQRISKVSPIQLSQIGDEIVPDRFCDADTCTSVPTIPPSSISLS